MPHTLFPTAIGRCAIAWTDRGINGVQLPEANDDDLRKRIVAKSGEEDAAKPPRWVRDAVKSIQRHLEGTPESLASVKLDLSSVPPFHARVYQAARSIDAGKTVGYGDLAKLAGSPLAARAVGQAMQKNPFPIVVPCHRVLAAGGKPGGFSAHGGMSTKQRMLAIEGVELKTKPEPTHFDAEKAVKSLSAADPKLAKLIEKVGPLRINFKSIPSPFEALAEAIVYQQLTGKAAATIFARVRKAVTGKTSGRGFTPKAVIATADSALRLAGLSGAKLLALKDLAEKTLDRTVPTLAVLHTLDDDEIVARLSGIRGIGRWTVEMLLIFRLGRPDVLPIHDYGVRKGFARVFGKRHKAQKRGADLVLPTPKEVEAYGERWRPYRTAASWYLWRACELTEET